MLSSNQLVNLLSEFLDDAVDLECLKLLSINFHDFVEQVHELLAVTSRDVVEKNPPLIHLLRCPHGEVLSAFLAYDSAFTSACRRKNLMWMSASLLI